MKCDHCPKVAAENAPICKHCKWYLYLKNHRNTKDLIRKSERELHNEKLNCAAVYMQRRVKRLEDDIMCVVDRVAISKTELLKRNCYNVTDGIKSLIAKTVSAKCKKLNEEFAYTISQCLLDGKEKNLKKVEPSWAPPELISGCSTSTLTGKSTITENKNTSTGTIKKRRKKRKASVSANASEMPTEEFIATYHSQIIADENRIKIRIKRGNLPSPTQHVNDDDKNETRKRQYSDADNLDSETSNKRNRMDVATVLPNESKTEEEEPGEQSVEGFNI